MSLRLQHRWVEEPSGVEVLDEAFLMSEELLKRCPCAARYMQHIPITVDRRIGRLVAEAAQMSFARSVRQRFVRHNATSSSGMRLAWLCRSAAPLAEDDGGLAVVGAVDDVQHVEDLAPAAAEVLPVEVHHRVLVGAVDR